MDYFNGITTEDFVEYFLKDLNCMERFIQYIYPNEMLSNERSVIDDHIQKCQGILMEYMINILHDSDNRLTTGQVNDLLDEKMKELMPILSPMMNVYADTAKVDYINLRN